jgi:UDP-N-acetylmuramyl pentapeptide phosphotransferase/UDP-N-acetylglucosamine-1-phosphate transferase
VNGASTPRSALALAAARGAGRRLGALLRDHPPAGPRRWERRNHRGATVTLLEGPTAALAVAAGSLAARPPYRGAGVVAALGAGAFGALDDLTERAGDRDAGARGLRGHLEALRRRRVTTGAWKVLGIGATGLAAAVVVDRPRAAGQAFDTLVGGALVAGSANLLNLFDLRPGRAAKVATVVAVSLAVGAPGSAGAAAARPCAAAVLGACSAVLPDDLAGRSMLGDTGANALGGVLGVAALARWNRPGRCLALATVVGLTLASERISFSRVIESVPVLRELDRLGRP